MRNGTNQRENDMKKGKRDPKVAPIDATPYLVLSEFVARQADRHAETIGQQFMIAAWEVFSDHMLALVHECALKRIFNNYMQSFKADVYSHLMSELAKEEERQAKAASEPICNIEY